MGDAGDKTLADLGGEPLIARTVAAFEECDAIEAVVVVAGEGNLDAVAELRGAKGWRKTAPPVLGGARRQDSVRIGLDALPPECEWVVVHDGARPFVAARMIEDGLRAAAPTGAAVAVVPAYDTVKRVAPDGSVIETLDRSELALVQTPQVFRRDVLERAHAQVTEDVTDDAAMAERIGVEVRTFDGARSNMKVTTPEDLVVAGALLGEGVIVELSRLEFIELSVLKENAEKHATELWVIDNAFSKIREGFENLHSLPDSEPEIEIQEARMLLAARAFKALRSARILFQYGCYEQSLVLVRTSMEHLLVAYEVEFRRETLEALKKGSRFNVGELLYSKMVDRVATKFFNGKSKDDKFKSVWEQTHRLLNQYVHPGGTRRQQISLPGGTIGYVIPFAGRYDEHLATVTLNVIDQNLLYLILLVLRLTAAVGIDWQAKAVYQALQSAQATRLGIPFPIEG